MYWLSQVILHTYIDGLRVDDDREINHHGKPVKANSNKNILFFSKTLTMTMRLTLCLQSLTNLETQIMIGSLRETLDSI